MPIEFRCSQCGKLLRTADDTAGRPAKCPECGHVQTVPGHGVAPASAPPPPAEDFNAYRSPRAEPVPISASPFGQSGQPIVPTRFEVGELFSTTWEIFKARFADCLVVFLLFLGVSIAISVFFALAQAAVHVARHRELVIMFPVVRAVIEWVFNTWIQLGLMLFMLKVAAGLPANYSDLFAGGPYMARMIGGGLLVGLMVVCGLILFIVPGVIVALMFALFGYALVDRNLPVIEALQTSREIMRGNKLTYFAAAVLMTLIVLGGVVFTCGLGILVVGPLANLMAAVAYRMASGQHRGMGQMPLAGPAASPFR